MCPQGFRLSTDGFNCIPLNSCEFGTCSQFCAHNETGHYCSCHQGYRLDSDAFTCLPVNESLSYVLFSNRHEIRSVDLLSLTSARPLVTELKNTISLDFYCSPDANYVFWTDVVEDKIYRGTLVQGSLINIQPIVETGLSTAEGLAVDWIGQNLYWVESNLDQIEVAKFDGAYRKTLIAGQMENPRSIALDPRLGLMFWTDWDTLAPRIERASMAGDERIVVHPIRLHHWPNGLTLDYENLRVYWVDARMDSIQSITYDGKDYRVILQEREYLAHPFSISLFGVHVYWTDWRTSSVVRANKFNGSDVTVLQKTMSQPFDVKIFSALRQPRPENATWKNPCTANGGCSHLCLLNTNDRVKCDCPHVMRLGADNRTCVPNERVLLISKPNELRGVDVKEVYYHIIPPISLPKIVHSEEIDFHADQRKIYWADSESNEIKRSNISGGPVEVVFDTVLENPYGIAVDWMSGNLFVTSQEFVPKIYVCKLNGEFILDVIHINLWKPFSLAVSPAQGKLFWTDHGSEDMLPFVSAYIGMANMDGSQVTKLVTEGSRALTKPHSLTVDLYDQKPIKLYWVNIGASLIQFYDFKTSKVGNLMTEHFDQVDMAPFSPYALCVNEDKVIFSSRRYQALFWTEKGENLTKVSLLRNNTDLVTALRIYDKQAQQGTNLCSVNNGNCSHLCLPISSSQRVCRCAISFTPSVNDTTKCEALSEFLVYSGNFGLRGISTTSNSSQPFLPLISRSMNAISVDFHFDRSQLFWLDGEEGSIVRINRDTTEHRVLISGLETVESLAVDWIANNIYWIESTYGTIEVSNLDGSNRFVLLSGGMKKATSIGVDPLAGFLFWTDKALPIGIHRSRLDGSERRQIYVGNDREPIRKLALDIDRQLIYWLGTGYINRVDYQGKSKQLVYAHEEHVKNGVSLATFNDQIYWADLSFERGAIFRAQLGRTNRPGISNVTILARKTGDLLKDLRVHHVQRQSRLNPCAVNNGDCEELCFFMGGRRKRCECSHGQLAADGLRCRPYDSFVMFSRVSEVESIHVDDKHVQNSPYATISDRKFMRNVIALAFDFARRRLLYSDIQRGSINSMFFNGTDQQVLVERQGAVEGLAYDFVEQHLYWTSNSDASISRLLLRTLPANGTVEKLLKLQVADKPRGIAVDACSGILYWTNWNSQAPSVQRAFINNLKVETIIKDEIRMPNAIALDLESERLYWSDARLDKIERCNYDGSGRVVILSETPQHPFDLAIHGRHLFWTDWVAHGVLRVDKRSGADLRVLRRNVPRPMGIIAVDERAQQCNVSACSVSNGGCSDLCRLNEHGQVQCECRDGRISDDGRHCRESQCAREQFHCKSGECIPYEMTCNNEPQCFDGSDERTEFCEHRQCPAGFFKCDSRRCHPEAHRCNGITECHDASDERNCSCAANEFRCRNSGFCIAASKRCDQGN